MVIGPERKIVSMGVKPARICCQCPKARRIARKDGDDARQLRGYSLIELGERHLAELGISLAGVGNKSERAERMLQARNRRLKRKEPV